MLEQERHADLDLGRFDRVVIIQDQHDVVGQRVELVEQWSEDGFDGPVGRFEERQRLRADRRRHRPQRGDQVRPEGDGMVVAGIEREPHGHRPAGRRDSQPFGQERRLAEPGRGRDERQLRLGPTLHAIGQVRPGHQATPPPRGVELAVEQRACHAPRYLAPRIRAAGCRALTVKGSWRSGNGRSWRARQDSEVRVPIRDLGSSPSNEPKSGS